MQACVVTAIFVLLSMCIHKPPCMNLLQLLLKLWLLNFVLLTVAKGADGHLNKFWRCTSQLDHVVIFDLL